MIASGAQMVVAVSGGADSLALLDALRQIASADGVSLHVATLDHGIRGAAGAEDAAFVRALALDWGLPVTVGRADVPAVAQEAGIGLEAAARGVRYAFLLRLARQIGAAVIAVGHTQDDQAETVLLHLIRGSGLRGLRGMLPVTPLTAGHVLGDVTITFDPPLTGPPAGPDLWPTLIRPLIDTSRAQVDAYVAARGLTPHQDATNADSTYLRNRVRHEVLPILAALNPEIRAGLARTADILRADAELVEQAGVAALDAVRIEAGEDALALDRAAWARLSLAEKRIVLRQAVARVRPDLADLAFVHVEDAVRLADGGTVGSTATLPGGLALRVDYAALVIGPDIVTAEIDAPLLELGQGALSFVAGEVARVVIGAWQFEAGLLPPGADVAAIHADPLAAVLCLPPGAALGLRSRRRGDRFAPRGMHGRSQKLADTLINMKVPAHLRDRLALVTVDDAVVWFAAPTVLGLRGRAAESVAFDASICQDKMVVMVRWRRAVMSS